MKAYWIAFDTSLKPAALAARRRRLAMLLRRHQIELVSVRVGGEARRGNGDAGSAVARAAGEAHGAPVIALDDGAPMPDKAAWLAKLTEQTRDLLPAKRPQLIYVTAKAVAEGTRQAARHELVRGYIKRDPKGLWVVQVAQKVAELIGEQSAAQTSVDIPKLRPGLTASLPVIGQAGCFRSAVEKLCELLTLPYGLVTGEAGVGKLYLIRALWDPPPGNPRVIVLPCGSFFKDYYVGGTLRRIGGGREAVDQLGMYFEEARDGLLVLHHVQKLPTAIQEELVARMSSGSGSAEHPNGLMWVDQAGVKESDITVVATSDFEPEFLRQTGRLIPELADKLCRRHVHIPSLAERGAEDIRLLCEHLLIHVVGGAQNRGGRDSGGGSIPKLSWEVMETLCGRSWPGNVSELIRVLEYAARQCHSGVVRLRDLPPDAAVGAGRPQTLDEIVRQAQIAAIQNALDRAGGSVSKAAAFLDRNRTNLHRLMTGLGIQNAWKMHGKGT